VPENYLRPGPRITHPLSTFTGNGGSKKLLPGWILNRGSVPEIIEHGLSGFIVDDADGAVNAALHIGEIDRRRCRDFFERRFTVDRMTRDYLKIYARLLSATEPLVSPAKEPMRFPHLQHSLGND
jgi:hypothetical protein